MSTTIVALCLMYFTGKYGTSFSDLRYTKTNIKEPCCPNTNYEEEDMVENEDNENLDMEIRQRKPQKMITRMVTSENNKSEEIKVNKIQIKDIEINKSSGKNIVVKASIV